jgi:hypothetical protein
MDERTKERFLAIIAADFAAWKEHQLAREKLVDALARADLKQETWRDRPPLL